MHVGGAAGILPSRPLSAAVHPHARPQRVRPPPHCCAAGSSRPPTASSCSTTKWCWRTTARATKAGSCRARASPPSRCAPAPLHLGLLKHISVVNGLGKLLPPLGLLHLEVLYMYLPLTMRPVVGPCDRAT